MKLKIFHKGLVFISIPLFFEIFVFSVLINLNDQAESAARTAEKSRRINDQINILINDCYAISRITKGVSLAGLAPKASSEDELMPTLLSAHGLVEAYSNYREAAKKYLQDIAQLKALVSDNPENLAIVERSENAALEINRLISKLRSEIPHTPFASISKVLAMNRHQLDALVVQILSPELINIAHKEAQEEKEQRNLRMRHLLRNSLFGAIGASMLLALSLVFLFSRNLSTRLSKLQENAILLSQRSPLQPRLSGNDEIAELDQAYHQAALLLSESEQKLQQTFDYAADLICSLNDQLKIVVANKAWLRLMALEEDELIGNRIINLITRDSRESFTKGLEQALQKPGKPITTEIRLRIKDGSVIDTISISQWVESQKTYFCVFHDISERKKAEQIRRETYSMISHDLRTPVTSFSNFVEMLEMGIFGPLNEKGEQFLDFAGKSVQKMQTLLEDILLLEKIKSGATKPTITRTNVAEILDHVAGPMQLNAHSKQIDLIMEPTESTIDSDPSIVEKVLSNFLSNAIRISPSGSTVRLYHIVEENKDVISVEDEGPGIDEEVQEKLFERFYKQDLSDDDGNLPSSGLGLTICKELATLIDGKIKVKSKKGTGATFSLVLERQTKRNSFAQAEQKEKAE